MASQKPENSWHFGPALELLHTPVPSELILQPAISSSSSSSSNSGSDTGEPKRRATLGDFDRVFRALNKQVMSGTFDAQRVTLDDEPCVSDDGTTPPTTPHDGDPQRVGNVGSIKEVRWVDQVIGTSTTSHHKHMHSAGTRPTLQKLSSNALTPLKLSNESKASSSKVKKTKGVGYTQQEENNVKQRSDAWAVGSVDAEDDDNSANWWLAKSHYEISRDDAITSIRTASTLPLNSAQHLRPAWVTPLKAQPKLWQSPASLDFGFISPMLHLTRQEKKARLIRRLGETLGFTFLQYFKTPGSLSQYGGNIAADGIHVFVDSSNIAIGFHDALKLARGLPLRQYAKRARLSFHSLALIMERGRNVSKRVLVGSSDRDGQLLDYMREAERCGYEINCLRRVEKLKEGRSSTQRSRTGNGYGNSGQSSGSETQQSLTKKVTEQGVDEILHMKMLESIVDSTQPSIIVLATGDAAEAEYSGGFLKNVVRALSKGWKVELVAWGNSMSYAYKSKDFLQEWEESFTIIDLDNFSEELYGSYID